jgi:hypothetical protein
MMRLRSISEMPLAAGFVARWCRQLLPEVADGAFVVRDDDPTPPRRAPLHRTP